MIHERKKIVFLGTPNVAALVLKRLLQENLTTQIVAVVSQPPARALRGKEMTPSPVHRLALENGIPVLTPETAKDESFLKTLQDLKPDLCITAAYGNILPNSFLDIPKYGTLNIHPSLLPLYRGAAPVQRAVEDGVDMTGVTILYTVEKMDAGPIVFQKEYRLDEIIKAPQLLENLFLLGAEILANGIDDVFENRAKPIEQNHELATRAKKISIEESHLDFGRPARSIHNKVRAFAGWPGTKARLEIDKHLFDVKVITTRVAQSQQRPQGEDADIRPVNFANDALQIPSGDGQVLEITELQMPGKKIVTARDFWNGIKTKTIVCHSRF